MNDHAAPSLSTIRSIWQLNGTTAQQLDTTKQIEGANRSYECFENRTSQEVKERKGDIYLLVERLKEGRVQRVP